jgi:hypothetical protein
MFARLATGAVLALLCCASGAPISHANSVDQARVAPAIDAAGPADNKTIDNAAGDRARVQLTERVLQKPISAEQLRRALLV